MLILKFKYIFKCCQHKKVPNTTSALLLFNKYPQNSTQKNVCITFTRNGFASTRICKPRLSPRPPNLTRIRKSTVFGPVIQITID
jgi:hypothetical protein